jgi:glycosyltransferase involved in cell wall biosynthesis
MRFADAFECGFAGSDVSMRHEFPARSPLAERLHLQRWDSYLKRSLLHPHALRTANADVFHIIDHSYAGAAKWLPGARTIVTCHDLALLAIGRADLPGRERRAVGRFRRRVSAMAQVAAVVCDSTATKRDVLRFTAVSPQRIRVIPAGVAPVFRPLPPAERDDARRRLGVGARFVLLHVDTGGFRKNVPATLRTLAVLRASGTDIALARVGVALNQNMRQLAANLGVAAHVKELGRPRDVELCAMYGAVDALIFPSLHEGFGLPVLEAMACGTPVVASNIGALDELLDGSGLTAPPDDIEGFAAAVRDIVSSPALADRLSTAGLARAQSFTWQRVVEDYRRLYLEVSQTQSSSRR